MARLIRFAVAMFCVHAGLAPMGLTPMGLAPMRSAQAAQFVAEPTEAGTWVHIRGDIAYRDGARFSQFLTATQGVTMVVLSGAGGITTDAVEVGTAIRARGLATLVRNQTACASACAIAWLGGTRRYMEKAASIGFHAAYTLDMQGKPAASQQGNGMSARYLGWMGVSNQAIAYLTAPSSGGAALTLEQTKTIGINAELYDPEPTTTASPTTTPPTTTAEDPADPRLPAMERTARQFAATYFEESGQRPAFALEYFQTVYADLVTYNGTAVPRTQVLDAQTRQAKRWPERAYAIRPESITVKCYPDPGLCDVSGITDWEWSNWGRGARANGASRFWFQITVENNTSLIRAEIMSELSRETTGPDEPPVTAR